jgi:hypothetical protein
LRGENSAIDRRRRSGLEVPNAAFAAPHNFSGNLMPMIRRFGPVPARGEKR